MLRIKKKKAIYFIFSLSPSALRIYGAEGLMGLVQAVCGVFSTGSRGERREQNKKGIKGKPETSAAKKNKKNKIRAYLRILDNSDWEFFLFSAKK